MKYTYDLHPGAYIADDIQVKNRILLRWLNSPRKLLKLNYYVVYLSDRKDELLTMIPAADIALPVYGMSHRKIVGVGTGYYGTMRVIHQIVRDVLADKGSVEKDDVNSFFKEREGASDES